jgi:hypothetical protein
MDTVTVGSTIAVPNTGSLQTYQTVAQAVNLTAGTHIMRVTFDTGSVAFNWIDFAAAGSCAPESDATFCTRLAASCGAFTGTDNCGALTATNQLAGLTSGSLFPVGLTTNTFEVMDAAGNKLTAGQRLTVYRLAN